VKYIDVHVHPVLIQEALDMEPRLLEAARKVFNIGTAPQPLSILLKLMDNAGVEKAVLLALDAKVSKGYTIPSNTTVYKLVKKAEERLVGFASVNPKDSEALKELKTAIEDYGFKGIKIHPPIQGIDPLDRDMYKVYERAIEYDVPILLHSGFTWVYGYSIDTCNPVRLEKIAIHFPELKLILGHMGWPWVREAVALAMKYPNVFLETSNVYTGTPEEHMRHIFQECMPKRLFDRFIREKVIFGSDYPRIEIDKMVGALKDLDLEDMTKEKILRENALNILKLSK